MVNLDKRKLKIGVLTPPIGVHSYIPLSNLLRILTVQSPPIYLITGNDGYTFFKTDPNIITSGVTHGDTKNDLLRVLKFFLLQVRISFALIQNVNKCDIWLFFLGGENMILPMFAAKLYKKKVVLLFAGSSVHTLYDDTLVSWLRLLIDINCKLCDHICVYSDNLIKEWQLEQFRSKILIAHRHFLDFTTFTVTTPYTDRPPHIGYIGRLSGEKGVQHFAQALPAILSNHQDLRVLIGGDGQLKKEIEDSLQDGGIADRVDLPGWISHDDLPKYLNQLRLLIIPSYTEGLPNIMLEAMACGTPVLATPVGAIPDVIRDGETGFIMEDNSQECIARNVMRALNDLHLEEIAKRGRAFVKEEFTFEKVVERWKGIFDEI